MKSVADDQSPVPSAAPVEGARVPRAERPVQFEREVLPHLDGLYTFARKLTPSRHDAEDLVSDTVLRAFDRWEQYTLGTNARAWLFTILYHLFVGRWRTEGREVTFPEHEDGTSALEPVAGSDGDASYYDSIVDDGITRAIEELPPHYRDAVVLSDVNEFRYTEIAAILGVPEGTAKSRLFRGRRMLQKKLLGYAVEMGYVKPRAA